MPLRHVPPVSFLAVSLLLGACGGSTTATTATTTTASMTGGGSTVAPGAGGGSIANAWSAPAVDPTKLPLGDAHVSTTTSGVGTLFVCDAGNPGGGGAFKDGPWIDTAAGTWDSTQKVRVQGEHTWPTAAYAEQVEGDQRVITSNGLPTAERTGTFPIAADDPAYAYDRNPNSIGEQAISVKLPVTPTAASTPACLPKGAIGVLKNGVAVFASIDALNRDAVAHETQDVCDGHPERSSVYHYHDVPSCLRDATSGSSTVVGFAYDGFPIVVERDAAGNLPANGDLDACHGRTSPIVLDGTTVTSYHYSATQEFPYFIGCYHGTAVVRR